MKYLLILTLFIGAHTFGQSGIIPPLLSSRDSSYNDKSSYLTRAQRDSLVLMINNNIYQVYLLNRATDSTFQLRNLRYDTIRASVLALMVKDYTDSLSAASADSLIRLSVASKQPLGNYLLPNDTNYLRRDINAANSSILNKMNTSDALASFLTINNAASTYQLKDNYVTQNAADLKYLTINNAIANYYPNNNPNNYINDTSKLHSQIVQLTNGKQNYLGFTPIGDTSALHSQIVTNTALINLRLKYTDTASMLSNYAKTSQIPIITGKLNISDTASMLAPYAKQSQLPSLAPYVKYSDTALMLSNYAKTSQIPINNNQLTNGSNYITNTAITGKVNYTDTAVMLANYAKTSQVNLKLNISDTSAMLSPYYRNSTATAALANKMNYSDTASLSNRINLKLNISDTSNMLNSYYRTAAANAALANKLNITDTLAMLSAYLRKADTASLSNRINQLNYKPTIYNNVVRALNSTFIIDANYESFFTYSIKIAITLAVGTISGTVTPQYSIDGGTTYISLPYVSTTPTVALAGLNVGAASTQVLQVSGWVPKNALVRIATTTVTGVTYTFSDGQERH